MLTRALPGALPGGICSWIRMNGGTAAFGGVLRGHPKPWFGAIELSVSPARCRAGILSERDFAFCLWHNGKLEELAGRAVPWHCSRLSFQSPRRRCTWALSPRASVCARSARSFLRRAKTGCASGRAGRLAFLMSASQGCVLGNPQEACGGSGHFSPLARTCPSRGGPRERALRSRSW